MERPFVERIEGAYRVAGSRVSLDSVVYSYLEGLSASAIAEDFPALTLEQVNGAIEFDLSNRQMVDAYLREGEELSRQQHAESRRRNGDLIERLRRARHESQIPS